jgi:hypothetical protein
MKTPELFRKGCILDRQKDAIAVSPFFEKPNTLSSTAFGFSL